MQRSQFARPSAHLIAYAASGVSLAMLFSLRLFPNATSAIWHLALQSDLGNTVAALIAVGGYLLDHWNSRKSQQLDAQIQRVTAQSHQLLVPVTAQFQSLYFCSTIAFIDKHMGSTSHLIATEYGDENYESKILKQFTAIPVFEMPSQLSNPSVVAFMTIDIVMSERSSKSSIGHETISGLSARTTSPRELPRFLHTAIEKCERPTSALWRSYEAFIRHEFVPGVDRIAEIIDEHGHLMEPLPPERLAEIFSSSGTGYGQTWDIAPRGWLYSMWLSYARSWKTLLAMWDEGIYEEIRPSVAFPVGIMFFNVEAQTQVAKVEQKLVGMSQMHGYDMKR